MKSTIVCTAALFVAALAPASQAASQTGATHARIALLDANQSTNWGGYNQGALDHDLFHRVTGDWVVPTATQHQSGRAEYSSAWIGIGGGCSTDDCLLTDSTLIQTGTEQDVGSNGRASYSAWYELIPGPSLDIGNVTVRPGDRMHADIAESVPGVWSITLSNTTLGQTFNTTVPYSSTYGSAEWIVETPVVIGTDGAGFAAMPNLSRVTFTNAGTNGAPANLDPSQEMQLVDGNGSIIVQPSAPGADRASFNACTYANSCAAP